MIHSPLASTEFERIPRRSTIYDLYDLRSMIQPSIHPKPDTSSRKRPGLHFKEGEVLDFRMWRFRSAERESGRRRSINDDHEADGPEESISDEENICSGGLSCFPLTTKVVNLRNNHSQSAESDRCAWNAISEEANELASLFGQNTNAFSATTSDIKRTRRDGKSKGKHKFSIHFQTQNKDIYWRNLVDDENIELYDTPEVIIQQNVKDKNPNHSITDLLHEVRHQNATQKDDQISRKLTVPDTSDRNSISMLLEDLQDSDDGFEMLHAKALPNKKSCSGKTVNAGKKLSSLLGERLLDNEDNFEHIDNRISSDDEDQNIERNQLCHATKEIKGKMMVDLFQEAFTSVVMESEWPLFKQSGIGYYGRLQQIIQIEKDRHSEFLKQLQTGIDPCDESAYITVQILSRLLDAKLTVCRCLLGGNDKASQYNKGLKTYHKEKAEKTVIFRSKICDDVDLEVGKMIRLYHPWNVVHISPNEGIILCTYFSQAPNSL